MMGGKFCYMKCVVKSALFELTNKRAVCGGLQALRGFNSERLGTVILGRILF